MNMDAKSINKKLAQQIQQHFLKSIMCHDQVRFIPEIPEWVNTCQSINVT